MDNKEEVKEIKLSAIGVLLWAVNEAQKKGVYEMKDMLIISQAYHMLSEAENKQKPPPENKVLENETK